MQRLGPLAVLLICSTGPLAAQAGGINPTTNRPVNDPELRSTGGLVLPSVACDDVDLLVSMGQGGFGYNYGGNQWPEFTTAIDGTAASVTVTSDLENLAFMMQFDALWVDQRWNSGTLSTNEQSNIAAYLASGRRVVLMGENSNWGTWNGQILGIVGGSYSGGIFNGIANAILGHELTTGVTQVDFIASGIADNGTALFDQNVVSLWETDQNVLVILDVNIWAEGLGNVDNATFMSNVVDWIVCSNPIPVELESFWIE